MSKGFNSSYIGLREDIQKHIPLNSKMVLDVGCSNGALSNQIKIKTKATVYGIEISEEMAKEARSKLDHVLVGSAEEMIEQLECEFFDVIIFADVLEHLVDPWITLAKAKEKLKNNGIIVTSLPNIRHIDTIFNLVIKGRWPYRERGIHDKTHLRFFTKKNILELFETCDLNVETIEANYRIIEKPSSFNRFAKYLALPFLRDFLAFQYLVVATK